LNAGSKLGIVAGGGDLPIHLIEACRSEGRPVFVLALEGHADAAKLGGVETAWIRLGEGGRGIALLRQAGVVDLVLAGRVRRPALAELMPDARTAKVLAKAGLNFLGGDNALIKTVVRELEGEGFRVVGPETLTAALIAPEGVLGRHAPDDAARADIARGLDVVRALGRLDVGQAAVVQQGIVLGVEAVDGTDALIERAGRLRRDGLGGVLVKAAKPGQERRVDLPAIGADTVARAAAAGLRGIAVEAGGTLILGRAGVVRDADAAGLFIIGIT
jgi:UDP-2,3-diacylglucosamine hydrolase